MKNSIRAFTAVMLGSVLAFSAMGVVAEESKAKSLNELLKLIEKGRVSEAKENKVRESLFQREKAQQANMLKEAELLRKQEEEKSAALEKQFEENDVKLAEVEQRLRERMGSLTELFGHLTSATGDARSNFASSLISIHYRDRDQFLEQLVAKASSGTELPSIAMIERLWFELQREMIESGKTVAFDATVVKPNGEQLNQKVVRVGSFNVVSEEGKYLSYEAGEDVLEELPRQPAAAYTSQAAKLVSATDGFTKFGIDPTGPTGGSFLAALINSPTLEERWHQGGIIGYIITGVGAFAFLIAMWRLLVLTIVGMKVNSQLKSEKAKPNNPLGRVLAVQEENPNTDPETLELKLSEAVLKELPSLENSLNLLKIIAAVAPLLGLLGTVTGMIITFQAITIFGAGDPKAMAGGISGALVTTVLGLVVAIPTVLLHTIVNGRSKKIIHILEEQTTGIIAKHNEAKS
jgi:biopolymer transport protein ExbB